MVFSDRFAERWGGWGGSLRVVSIKVPTKIEMCVVPAALSDHFGHLVPSLLTVSSQQESLKPIYLPSTLINFVTGS